MSILGLINAERIYWRFRFAWKRALRLSLPDKGKRVLIVPCDPWSVIGSRGDQAMIMAVLQYVRGKNPSVGVDVLANSCRPKEQVAELGLQLLSDWDKPFDLWMAEHGSRYGEVFILGADVTDGVYGFPIAMQMLMFYDVFSRLGVLTHYLGFSWSTRPNRMMGRVLRHLTRGLPLHVRDAVSMERLKAFTRHRPVKLVADSAFMLKPRRTERVEKVYEWCKREKVSGALVLVVNAHPMFADVDVGGQSWQRNFAEVLTTFCEKQQNVRLIFFPHDDRAHVSDVKLLAEVFRYLSPRVRAESLLLEEAMSADEIKAAIGCCDGVVAGRMHFSIAALGQGVPVLALVYQGKFEGLWRHFELPLDTLVEPKTIMDDHEAFSRQLTEFVDGLHGLKTRITSRLPQVLSLAEENFK